LVNGDWYENGNRLKTISMVLLFVIGYCFIVSLLTTVEGTSSWTRERQFGHGYRCHFRTEMAEIRCPGTFFQDVWACQISALYLLYFKSYETFSGGI